MTRSRIVTCLAVGLCVLAAGCGGDEESDAGSSDAPAITKADFVSQANAICKSGDAEVNKAAQELGDTPSKADVSGFVANTLVPNIRGQIDDIRALGFPEADADTLGGILDQADSVLDDIESDPEAAVSSSDPFAKVKQGFTDYGLTDCAN